MEHVVAMSNTHKRALETIDKVSEELRESPAALIKKYNSLVEQELERIGNLPTSTVTVAELEWYNRAKTGAFYYAENRPR